ncbi:MAG: Uma2 family endonuclease [bacterium]|nr:Uma2 family endonuclease [bacterium]
MSAEKTRYTSAEFWEFVNADENFERRFERINGEIVQLMPAGMYVGIVTNLIAYFVTAFVLAHRLGFVTSAETGYEMSEDDTFAPDIAFVSYKRQTEIPPTGFNPIPPDFAVEVVSPSDLEHPKERIEKKLNRYKALRIPLLWYVYPNRKEVEVYVNGEFLKTVGLEGTLDGGDVLPGFTLEVRSIFPD